MQSFMCINTACYIKILCIICNHAVVSYYFNSPLICSYSHGAYNIDDITNTSLSSFAGLSSIFSEPLSKWMHVITLHYPRCLPVCLPTCLSACMLIFRTLLFVAFTKVSYWFFSAFIYADAFVVFVFF